MKEIAKKDIEKVNELTKKGWYTEEEWVEVMKEDDKEMFEWWGKYGDKIK